MKRRKLAEVTLSPHVFLLLSFGEQDLETQGNTGRSQVRVFILPHLHPVASVVGRTILALGSMAQRVRLTAQVLQLLCLCALGQGWAGF